MSSSDESDYETLKNTIHDDMFYGTKKDDDIKEAMERSLNDYDDDLKKAIEKSLLNDYGDSDVNLNKAIEKSLNSTYENYEEDTNSSIIEQQQKEYDDALKADMQNEYDKVEKELKEDKEKKLNDRIEELDMENKMHLYEFFENRSIKNKPYISVRFQNSGKVFEGKFLKTDNVKRMYNYVTCQSINGLNIPDSFTLVCHPNIQLNDMNEEVGEYNRCKIMIIKK